MGLIKTVAIKKVDLKLLRQKAGLSLRQLEKLTGIHFSHLGEYERDVLVMTEETWEKIRIVLDQYNRKMPIGLREDLKKLNRK